MFKWRYPAIAAIAVAATVPLLGQVGSLQLVGRAHAIQQVKSGVAGTAGKENEAKPKKRTRMSRQDARIIRETYERRHGVRPGAAAQSARR